MNALAPVPTMSRDHVYIGRLLTKPVLRQSRDSLPGAPDADSDVICSACCTGCQPSSVALRQGKRSSTSCWDAGLGAAEAEEMFRAMHESAHSGGSAHHTPVQH